MLEYFTFMMMYLILSHHKLKYSLILITSSIFNYLLTVLKFKNIIDLFFKYEA